MNGLKEHIAESAETRIRTLQPFQAGPAFGKQPLWVLSELDNAYKHRLL